MARRPPPPPRWGPVLGETQKLTRELKWLLYLARCVVTLKEGYRVDCERGGRRLGMGQRRRVGEGEGEDSTWGEERGRRDGRGRVSGLHYTLQTGSYVRTKPRYYVRASEASMFRSWRPDSNWISWSLMEANAVWGLRLTNIPIVGSWEKRGRYRDVERRRRRK